MDVKKRGVERHEQQYWHVPKANLWPLVGLMVFVFLAYANFLGVVWLWNELGLGALQKEDLTDLHQLTIIPSLLLEYFLVCGVIVSLVALVKGGYGKLKSFEEEGLLYGLLAGLLYGLLAGLLYGLLAGLLLSLQVGLLVGLLVGLGEEFR